MSRYIAICDMPNISKEQFQETFNRTRKWKSGRTWVLKAYCNLSEGKLVAECETPEKAQFEEWLKNTGWKVNGIYGVNLIHEAGAVWPV